MIQVVLAILDGWACNPREAGNAVRLADAPNLKQLFTRYPYSMLACSGEAVGLKAGQMGDSNVGHLNIGAGRVVYQPLVRITRAIDEGALAQSKVLQEVLQQGRNRRLHLMGLLSDGGVHSHIDHLYALLREAKSSGVEEVYIHAFLDGRDVPPKSALQHIAALEDFCSELGVGRIASVMGRFYAMDRDRRWERIEQAYRAIVEGQGETAPTACQAVKQAYAAGLTDEFVHPTVVQPEGQLEDGDAAFVWNFRADRARELVLALKAEEFTGFARHKHPQLLLAGMMPYDEGFPLPFVFEPADLRDTLGEVISTAGLKQLRIAETEKYAHVTFFFNGGREEQFANEERILVPSPKVATYELCPEMSARQVVARLLSRLPEFDLVVANFANMDMVGHTGVLEAAIEAVEIVDECVGRLVTAIEANGGALIITADHGNADQMIDYETGDPYTAHTSNDVPCIVIAPGVQKLRTHGMLADIAPTVLELLGLTQPKAMTGQSLLVGKGD